MADSSRLHQAATLLRALLNRIQTSAQHANLGSIGPLEAVANELVPKSWVRGAAGAVDARIV